MLGLEKKTESLFPALKTKSKPGSLCPHNGSVRTVGDLRQARSTLTSEVFLL